MELEHVNKSFPGDRQEPVLVLEGICLDVLDQEFVSLIGPSGCGKSTLFNIISGLLVPDSGSVRIHGVDVRGKTGHASYMHQKDLLLPWRTVLDNVTIPLEIRRYAKEAARAEAMGLMEVFGLAGFEGAYPAQLSGGMRQRAALLRTYLCKNDVMLLDEPFGSLDTITKGKLHEWLLAVWEQLRPTILFITHDIDEAILLSDRVYVLSERPATVREEVAVNLPRPRTKKMLTSHGFVATKDHLLDLLS
ncbi:hypothetical protein SY88_14515 [Clostridiales bacterium PH28_bin88]|nr:hypothetical protein SY88_14515 [Clostridiales bacterium PH28_bin88]